MHLNGKQYTLEHIIHLVREIDYLKTQIQPHDTGHIYTTISTLETRVAELMSEHDEDRFSIRRDKYGSYFTDSEC